MIGILAIILLLITPPILLMIFIPLFRLPLKDPEYEWRHKRLEKLFRDAGIDMSVKDILP